MSDSFGHARFCLLAASLLTGLALSGCVTHHHHDSYSPALERVGHGHLHVHSDHHVSLVYDADWGGYWVRERPHVYYHTGFYFRWHSNRWHRSRHPDGPWLIIQTRALPRGLHRHYARIARREAGEAWRKERREARPERHEERREHRGDRREARQEHHEDLRKTGQDRHEAQQEHREDRREARPERHKERREHRGDRREARQERRDDEQHARAEGKGKRGGQAAVPADQADDDEEEDDD